MERRIVQGLFDDCGETLAPFLAEGWQVQRVDVGTVTRLLPPEEMTRLNSRPGKPPILMTMEGVAYVPVFVAVLER